jgi:hypothetical protein
MPLSFYIASLVFYLTRDIIHILRIVSSTLWLKDPTAVSKVYPYHYSSNIVDPQYAASMLPLLRQYQQVIIYQCS